MGSYFKIEFKRGLSSKSFIGAIIIGFVIVMIHQIFVDRFIAYGSGSAYMFATGFDDNYMLTQLYYLLFPIMVALAGSDLFGEDDRSGIYYITRSRVSKKNYFTVKITLSFILGGLAFAFPLVIEMWGLLMFYPADSPDIFLQISLVEYGDLFASLFIHTPLLYWLIFLLFGFMYGGVYAWIGFLTSLFTNNKYLVLLMPFCVYYGLWVILSLFGYPEWSPFGFLTPAQGYTTISLSVILFQLIVSFILCLTIMIGKCKNEFV
ncbi:hypothetical protein BLX87_06385 [Bacillus sp. VT-16-64]|nr:hypothetical protein BLX87_06385 [Bacillus sp. VT-16-64]